MNDSLLRTVKNFVKSAWFCEQAAANALLSALLGPVGATVPELAELVSGLEGDS